MKLPKDYLRKYPWRYFKVIEVASPKCKFYHGDFYGKCSLIFNVRTINHWDTKLVSKGLKYKEFKKFHSAINNTKNSKINSNKSKN